MITKLALTVLLAFFSCNDSSSQRIISRDADGNIWLVTDTITHQMFYIGNTCDSIEVAAYNKLEVDHTKLDSLIMSNQYELWRKTTNYSS